MEFESYFTFSCRLFLAIIQKLALVRSRHTTMMTTFSVKNDDCHKKSNTTDSDLRVKKDYGEMEGEKRIK